MIDLRSKRAVVAVVVLAAALAAWLTIARRSGPNEPASAQHGGSKTARSKPSLLYVHRASLRQIDVETRSIDRIRELPGPDVFAAQGSEWLAYVSPDTAGLRLLNPTTGDEESIGRGLSPVWDAPGENVMFLRPEEGACLGEGCPPLKAAVLNFEVSTGTESELLPIGTWGLLGWAGDAAVVLDTKQLKVFHVDPTGDAIPLHLKPHEYWDVSPDGNWLIEVNRAGPRFVELEGAVRTGRTVPITLRGRLAAGSWSPDSSRVAAVTLGRRGEVVLFSPDTPDARPLPRSNGAAADVVWAKDGAAIAFVRVHPQRRRLLQVAYCRIQPRRPCRALFSYKRGVSLLRLSG